MAKKSMIAREKRREIRSERARKKRAELKKVVNKGDAEASQKAVISLQKRVKDESHTRLRSRCGVCGRPRAVLKKFGLCRIHLREAVMQGLVPGVRKASW